MSYKIYKNSSQEKTYIVLEVNEENEERFKHIVREEYWNNRQWRQRDKILNCQKVYKKK